MNFKDRILFPEHKFYFILMGVLCFVVDYFSKTIASSINGIFEVEHFEVFSFLAFEYVKNSVGIPLIIALPAVATVLFAALWIFIVSLNWYISIACAFVFAGMAGNGFDYIIQGYVVDFISFNGVFYIFNLGDVFMYSGVLIILANLAYKPRNIFKTSSTKIDAPSSI